MQARSHNIPGAQRSIKTIGASALSMSIVERAPIQITGYEHYNCWFHEWKCASAPIFNDNDIPIASLTISSHISCKDIHTLTLTTSCANCISIRLRESALIDTEKRLNAMLQRVLNSLPEAVVAIDGNGSITHANNKAANYLLPRTASLWARTLTICSRSPNCRASGSSCGGGFRRRGT
ncbi:MAG: PAS domain-containing protein [Bilophila wadsworthia]